MPWLRRIAGCGAAVTFVLAVTPPVLTGAGRRASLEAVQFALLGVIVPALIALWAPQRHVSSIAARGARVSDQRQRHATLGRALPYLVLEMAAVIVWRTPLAVDAIAHHRVLVLLEVVTLVPLGIALWLELVESPPLAPRLAASPGRAILAAVAMWTIWILAYLGGFSHAWYPAYVHRGGDAAWDQQITSAVLWFASAAAFIPVVFVTLHRWLTEGDRPDAELRKLLREERRRQFVEGGEPRSHAAPGREG